MPVVLTTIEVTDAATATRVINAMAGVFGWKPEDGPKGPFVKLKLRQWIRATVLNYEAKTAAIAAHNSAETTANAVGEPGVEAL